MKKNIVLTVFIVFILGILIGLLFNKGAIGTPNKDVVEATINEKLIQGDQKVDVEEIKSFGNISAVSLDFDGQEDTLYVNREGTVFFQKIYDQPEAAEAEAEKAELAKKELIVKDSDHLLGPSDALISIYDYSEFECPFCKRFYETPKQLIENNPGKVNQVYRHFTNLHAPLSTKEANAAECAGELGGSEIFYAYHDELYKRTNSNGRNLEKTGEYGLDVSELPKIAADLELDQAAFKTCLDEDRYTDKINADIASGSRMGVNGTPNAFIVNNETGEFKLIEGAYPIESVQAAIDELLK